jgi:DNA invertase Pin-like site-specific DNA recombinase
MPQIVIYTRQSPDRDHNELGIERQLEQGQAVCERRSWSNADIVTENDVSGSKHGRPRQFPSS